MEIVKIFFENHTRYSGESQNQKLGYGNNESSLLLTLSSKYLMKTIFMDKNVSLSDYYRAMEDGNIVLGFKGPISDSLLVGIENMIKARLREKKEASEVIKKVFSVFVELAQNVCFHSADRGMGILVIRDCKDCYEISSGNMIGKSEIAPLGDRIRHINSLESSELKKFYVRRLRSPMRTEKSGGNVGLIIVLRQSGNPIGFAVHPVDEALSFIEIHVKIGKKGETTMEDMIIEATEKTLKVNFEAKTGNLEIEGVSYSENTRLFFQPVMNWLKTYTSDPVNPLILNLKLNYLNSTSTKYIIDILELLEKFYKSGGNVQINWYCEAGDDMEEMGEEIAEDFKFPLKLISY